MLVVAAVVEIMGSVHMDVAQLGYHLTLGYNNFSRIVNSKLSVQVLLRMLHMNLNEIFLCDFMNP